MRLAESAAAITAIASSTAAALTSMMTRRLTRLLRAAMSAGSRSGIDQLAIDFAGAVLDKVEAVFGVAAHELVYQLLDHRALLELGGQGDTDQAAAVGRHGRFAELSGVHFAEALEAADLRLLPLEHR